MQMIKKKGKRVVLLKYWFYVTFHLELVVPNIFCHLAF